MAELGFTFDPKYPGYLLRAELNATRLYLAGLEESVRFACGRCLNLNQEKCDSEMENATWWETTLVDDVSRMIKMSLVTSIYALFENSVSQLLSYGQKRESKILSHNEVLGKSPLDRWNKYMCCVLGYDFQFRKKSEVEISVINRLRQYAAHRNGDISDLDDDKKQKLRNFFQKSNGVAISFYCIDVSYLFLRESLDVIDEEMSGLMLYMELKYGLEPKCMRHGVA